MEEALSGLSVSQQQMSRAPCANIKPSNGTVVNCGVKANLFCSKCRLVQYCTRECQVTHWPIHKKDCNSALRKTTWQPRWWIQNYEPAFLSPEPLLLDAGLRDLWSSIPAYSILNLAEKEGEVYDQDIALCFAASGDLCNVTETIVALPEGYAKTCTCVINDRDIVVVCRNVVMLLVMMLLPTPVATELVLHIWYSARLTSDMVRSLQESIRPTIAEFVDKIADKPDNKLLSKTWNFGKSVLTTHLYKTQWKYVLAMLEKSHKVDQTEELRKKIMLNDKQSDNRERVLFPLPPSRRVGASKMRQEGILLPFGSCLEEFKHPNPLLFNPRTSLWMLRDSAEPTASWPLQTILSAHAKYGTPPEDLYGLLYFHIREKLTTFHTKLLRSKIRLETCCCPAQVLPSLLITTAITAAGDPSPIRFDRIDASNLADRENLGLETTLRTGAALLHPPSTHPHAVLITHFLHAVREAEILTHCNDDESPTYRIKTQAALLVALELINKDPNPDNNVAKITPHPWYPAYLRALAALSHFRDHEATFSAYMDSVAPFALIAKRTRMKMREGPNTVVQAWPFRFRMGVKDEGAGEAFRALESSAVEGSERFVEWVRAE